MTTHKSCSIQLNYIKYFNTMLQDYFDMYVTTYQITLYLTFHSTNHVFIIHSIQTDMEKAYVLDKKNLHRNLLLFFVFSFPILKY